MFDVPEDLIHRIQELTRADKDYIYEKTGFYID